MSQTVQIEGVSRAVHRLAEEFAPVRLRIHWWGSQKTLDDAQKTRAAETFQAKADFLSASKRLINTKDESYKKLTTVKNAARKYWQSQTLPYPEDGVRLIRLDDVADFDQHMESVAAELRGNVIDLDVQMPRLIEDARERLGSLFNAAEYPMTFNGLFNIDWEYPNLNPPEYMKTINPGIYEQECARIRNRFSEAVELAEEAFLEQFVGIVDRLRDRMLPNEDGTVKRFNDATVEDAFVDFFERFGRLNVGSSEELERAVEEAREVLNGVTPSGLRNSADQREHVLNGMNSVREGLDELISSGPRRLLG